MSKRKDFSICRHCGRGFPPNKTQAYCRLECAYFARQPQGEEGECWEWQFARNNVGYGQFAFAGARYYAHRVAMLIAGALPGGRMACHSCDNPPCCNPAHLFAGTQDENMADMRGKGRGVPPPKNPTGRNAPNAKYTAHQIAHIQHLISAGMTNTEIARATGMSRSHVGNIRSGLHL